LGSCHVEELTPLETDLDKLQGKFALLDTTSEVNKLKIQLRKLKEKERQIYIEQYLSETERAVILARADKIKELIAQLTEISYSENFKSWQGLPKPW